MLDRSNPRALPSTPQKPRLPSPDVLCITIIVACIAAIVLLG